MLLLAVATSLLMASTASKDEEAADRNLVVNTSSGQVEGIRQFSATGKPVDMFWGIPYAEPPVGELRFRAPTPINK